MVYCSKEEMKAWHTLSETGNGIVWSVHGVNFIISLYKGYEMPGNILSGDQLAWALLAEAEPGIICQQADVQYDFVANKFLLQSFGQKIVIDTFNFTISSPTALGDQLLNMQGYFFDLACLWYLGKAKKRPLESW